MFKKNPNRPQIVIGLRKVSNGYKVLNNESFNPFSFKRITRAIFKSNLYSNNGKACETIMSGINTHASIVQPPCHVTIPYFARWFDMDEIHEIEREEFPEFFMQEDEDDKLFRKSPKLYKFYRNFIITLWRDNSKKYLSPAVCRKNLAGDVSCIIRIHAFLENWGLINLQSKEHGKGYIEAPANNYCCLICEECNAEVYYVAQVSDGVICEICDCCYHAEIFPQSISRQEFRRIIVSEHERKGRKLMTEEELERMLEIIHSEAQKERSDSQQEREIWLILGKEFPSFSKEQIMYNFLRVPADHAITAGVFQGEDCTSQKPPSKQQLTVFEDYENPQQSAIALSYYEWKTSPEKFPELSLLFSNAEKHSQHLAKVQGDKIVEMIRLLTDLETSKLKLKTIFLQEYEKLIGAKERTLQKLMSNALASALKNHKVENDEPAEGGIHEMIAEI